MTVAADFDNDGIDDADDVDKDNDTIPDVYEGLIDSDLDGLPDFLDLDSDNDSIPDINEAGHSLQLLQQLDSNSDGQVDVTVNLGSNGLANVVELVTDSSNLAVPPPDSDSDLVLDFRDLDSDNDGLSDRLESHNTEPLFAQVSPLIDVNADGWHDTGPAPAINRDDDGDGIANRLDRDSDQDGLSDLFETAGETFDRNNDGYIDQFIDFDGNGYQDALQGNPIFMLDTDNDGLPDHLDRDRNNDGVFDLTEAGFQDLDGNGMVDDDTTTVPSPPNPSVNPDPAADPAPVQAAPDGISQNVEPVTSVSPTVSEETTVLVTGINGNAHGGCSYQLHTNPGVDPLLLLMVLVALSRGIARPLRAKIRLNEN